MTAPVTRSMRHGTALILVLSSLGLLATACSTTTERGVETTITSATDASGNTSSGTVNRYTFRAADGTDIEYVLLVPTGRDVGEPGKVIFAFPPGGQDIDLAEELVNDKYRDEALARDYVVISPAAPSTGLFYDDASAALVPELLDAVTKDYPPEDGKLDLIGVSNGGLSAFKAAIAMPERFRSLVVFPGYSPDGADDPNLSKLKGIGVAMFVGGDDSGWRDASETTETQLKALGNTVELHVIEGESHILGDALPGKDLFDALERVRG